MNIWDLRTFRKARKVTIIELSERTGFSAAFISQLERGLLTQPQTEHLETLVLALGVRKDS